MSDNLKSADNSTERLMKLLKGYFAFGKKSDIYAFNIKKRIKENKQV